MLLARLCTTTAAHCDAAWPCLPLDAAPAAPPPARQMQLDGVRQDSVRQQSESSQLHLLLIQQAEKQERQDKEHYQVVKRLEDRISELSYWKHQAGEKLQAADRENASLRRRCDELLQLTDRLTKGARCGWRCSTAALRRAPGVEGGLVVVQRLRPWGGRGTCGSRHCLRPVATHAQSPTIPCLPPLSSLQGRWTRRRQRPRWRPPAR